LQRFCILPASLRVLNSVNLCGHRFKNSSFADISF
jgi:hypothetical protein